VLRPLVSVASTVLMILGLYDEGEWSWDKGYPYATLFYNIGVTISLYCLALFYKVAKEELRPFSPVFKFAAVKGIVFFTYWQSVIISIAVGIGIVPSIKGMEAGEVATTVQNLLICAEMILFAVAFFFAFPVTMYKISSRSQAPLIHDVEMSSGVIQSMKNAASQGDVILDTIESFVPGADPTSPNSRAQKKKRRREQEEFERGMRAAPDLADGDNLRLSFGNIELEDDSSEDSDSLGLPDDDPRKTNIRGRK
jgi:Organic solute transporter Ostalpha